MNPTVAAVIIRLLALLGLACSHVVERSDDLIRRLPRVILNLVIVGRYFGWLGLIASIGYFVLLVTTPQEPDATPELFFAFVYYFAFVVMVASVIAVPVRQRCHHCGKWDEFHVASIGEKTKIKGKKKVTLFRHNAQGEVIGQDETMQDDIARYAVFQYQCRHCGHRWEVMGKDEIYSTWDG